MSGDTALRAYWVSGGGARPIWDPAFEATPRERFGDFMLWYGLPYLIAVPVATVTGTAIAAAGVLLGWT